MKPVKGLIKTFSEQSNACGNIKAGASAFSMVYCRWKKNGRNQMIMVSKYEPCPYHTVCSVCLIKLEHTTNGYQHWARSRWCWACVCYTCLCAPCSFHWLPGGASCSSWRHFHLITRLIHWTLDVSTKYAQVDNDTGLQLAPAIFCLNGGVPVCACITKKVMNNDNWCSSSSYSPLGECVDALQSYPLLG